MLARRNILRLGRGRGAPDFGVAPTFLPTAISDAATSLKLWLRADQGVTLSSSSVNAFSAWTLSNCTRTAGQSDPDGGTNAFKLTDSVDGAPAVHTATGTLTNAQPGPAVARLWVKADAVLDQIQVQIGSTSTVAARFTFSTQTFSDLQNCTTALIETRGTWYLIEVQPTIATTTPVYIVYFSVGGTSSYQGAGTRSFFVYLPTYTQDRVSQLNDQSGNGNNATQGTAASQPLYRLENGLVAFGWPLAAGKTLALPNAFRDLFVGNGIPMTVIEVRKVVVAPGADRTGGIYLSTPGSGVQIMSNFNGAPQYETRHTDDGSVLKSQAGPNYTLGAWRSLVQTYSGTQGNMFVDGVAAVSNPADLDVGVETPTTANLAIDSSMRREIAVFNRVLTAGEYKAVENGMRRRWGLPAV